MDQQIAEINRTHQREVAELERRYNQAHFAVLNENAKRTIEERGHFVSIEQFKPVVDAMQSQVNSLIAGAAALQGQEKGGDKLQANLIAITGFMFGLMGIALAVYLAVTSSQ
jgi:phosphotransferase system  glucose/maltose/N-acetylglucosamine-specific IIC component